MTWILVAVCGAGAARAIWLLLAGYERMAAARDELDDSLHEHRPDAEKRDEEESDKEKRDEEGRGGGANPPI